LTEARGANQREEAKADESDRYPEHHGGSLFAVQGEGVKDLWWPYVPGPEVGRHTDKVLGAQTEGRLFQALISYPRGAAPPLHIHHDADETCFVLDGE